MRWCVPLPGTLVRTPSALGDFSVSQTLTVAQKGRLVLSTSERFVLDRAALTTRSPAPWPATERSAGFSATTTPGGRFGGASAPGGSCGAAAAEDAARRDAAHAIRTVGAASRGTTRGRSGGRVRHLSVGHW